MVKGGKMAKSSEKKKTGVGVIIPAAGVSRRMKRRCHKPFIKLCGKEILLWTIEKFQMNEICDVILVLNKDDMPAARSSLRKKLMSAGITKIVEGGERRQDSVARGLAEISPDVDVVLIHDAVRPFTSKKMIKAIIDGAVDYGAAVPGVAPVDTIKQVNQEGYATITPERAQLRCIQTPQGFRKDILDRAYAENNEFIATDDAALVEAIGVPVKIISGDPGNFKITTPFDLSLASEILRSK